MSLVEYIRNYGAYAYHPTGQKLVHVPPDKTSAFDEEPIQIEMQTVADYVAYTAAGEHDHLDFFRGLTLVPPFPYTAMHFDQTFIDPDSPEVQMRGRTVVFAKADRLADVPESEAKTELLAAHSDIGWVINFSVVVQADNKLPTLIPYTPCALLDVDGQLLRIVGGYDVHMAPSVRPELAETWRLNALSEVGTVLQAFAFMHVRHSVVEEVKPTRAAVRKAARKNKPLLRHHRLVVKPLEDHMRRVREHAKTPAGRKALHMVRGHFATYTEDAPLLGKFVGTVWRAPHWRGDKDEGVVTKDYQLEV